VNKRSTYQKPNAGRAWTRVTTGRAVAAVAIFALTVVALSTVGGHA
jgi:hypothetical protein